MLEVGTKAPDFTLQNQEGKEVSLSDFKGKKVILYFYPKDLTSGCTKQACGFKERYPLITEKGAVLFGDIDQVGGKSTGSGSALGIEGGVASSCVGMTATAGGSGIQGAFTSLKGIVSTDPGIVV